MTPSQTILNLPQNAWHLMIAGVWTGKKNVRFFGGTKLLVMKRLEHMFAVLFSSETNIFFGATLQPWNGESRCERLMSLQCLKTNIQGDTQMWLKDVFTYANERPSFVMFCM